MPLISVIVTTYNWPEALEACINSLLAQEDKSFEVIIADDGSTIQTRDLIEKFTQQNSIPVKHAYHDDLGFRAGTIRNKAALLSTGSYLIFIDGDCTVFPNFIKRHRQFSEQGYFVPGNRILLSAPFTATVLKQKIPLHNQTVFFFIQHWITAKINRITPLIYNPFSFLRYRKPNRWEKAMTCNLAMYKDDFINVNGFDEAFEGWGYEDSDLVIRLIHNGIKRKEGRFGIPVLHLWHQQNDQSKHDENFERLMQRLKDKTFIKARQGIEHYLS